MRLLAVILILALSGCAIDADVPGLDGRLDEIGRELEHMDRDVTIPTPVPVVIVGPHE